MVFAMISENTRTPFYKCKDEGKKMKMSCRVPVVLCKLKLHSASMGRARTKFRNHYSPHFFLGALL